uniref:Peroxiredoxin n=1 Tax=Candidatus Kentrum sp. LFY TaxID=2126342 RepID=A0A450UTP4_9GAMM|nr:MAG: Peroxiredoxin [Candidatus Kentron sp. LFY]
MGTPSTMLELGTSAPDFRLPDFGADGKLVSAQDFRKAPGLLVIFMCNHCPHIHRIREALADFAREYRPKGLAIVGINANDVANYPDDSPDKMAEEVASFGYAFPYLFDETQEVAKAYRAACTPDFFLFDKARKLVYRGQFDDSRPKNDLPITGRDLRAAVDALLSGKKIDADQKASVGCNIKWKEGNEPDYFRSIRLKPPTKRSPGSKSDAFPEELRLWGLKFGDETTNKENYTALETRQLEELAEYVRTHLENWLTENLQTPAVRETELLERVARVEEELGRQGESTKQGFDLMERRFEQLEKRSRQTDKRLETTQKQTDSRLEAMQKQMDKRFDMLTRRIERFMIWALGIAVAIAIVILIF